MFIGARIKELREANELSMKQFSELFNLSESVISLYESEKRYPSHNVILNIARHFSVSIDYLYGNDQSNNICDSLHKCTDDEKKLIESYRKLSEIAKAEIRGEIKGILRTTQEELSATLSNDNATNKKVI